MYEKKSHPIKGGTVFNTTRIIQKSFTQHNSKMKLLSLMTTLSKRYNITPTADLHTLTNQLYVYGVIDEVVYEDISSICE